MSDYNLSRLNFLIVDDNKHMLALVKGILHALGVKNVLEAVDGADAFKELRHFPADVIISDWNMSPLDGMDFVRMVRTGSDSPNPFVPIIMLTGYTEMNRVTEARDSGVHEFLAKPISAKKLYGRIKSIIEHPRSFVRVGLYFGPDRRRKANPNYNGSERRKEGSDKMVALPGSEAAKAAEAAPAPAPAAEPAAAADDGGEEGGMSQDDINALLDM
ncbi:MAG: two-component system response regulator [Rhodospirillaceae bacterium]|nr:MAG: two-component system response regulator [Rhodospirillaceae bacterium]